MSDSLSSEFENLYEVRKTINFEFKPSIYTSERVFTKNIPHINGNNIKVASLFKNEDKELIRQARSYLNQLKEDFSEIVEKFKRITDKIYQKNQYENFKIYIESSRIKLLGKDFRDCFQSMKTSRTKKGKGWDYYFKFNAATQRPEFRTVKFGDFLTIHHLFAFRYDKTKKIGEFESLFKNKIELLLKKYEFLGKELKDFLDISNQSEKFITKPEILYRIKSLAYCIQDILLFMSIFCDEGKNGSTGCSGFSKDLQDFKGVCGSRNFAEVSEEIIWQVNSIVNPKAHYCKFTLNFKEKNPNTQLSGNNNFLSEEELQKKLNEEMESLEKKKNQIAKVISQNLII